MLNAVSRPLITFAVVRRSPLRNRRHLSELCSVAAALGRTAGFAPSALLVSAWLDQYTKIDLSVLTFLAISLARSPQRAES
jgi:hypothetical protein